MILIIENLSKIFNSKKNFKLYKPLLHLIHVKYEF